jgi:hypothetical protein
VCPQFWESKEGVEKVDNARRILIVKNGCNNVKNGVRLDFWVYLGGL